MQIFQTLEPCPFCGGDARIDASGRDWYRLKVQHDTTCILEDFEIFVPQTPERLEMLEDDWNRRDEPNP